MLDRRTSSPYASIYKRKPDLSSWAAGPLVPVYVLRPGIPHLRVEARAELGLYVGPCMGATSAHEVRFISAPGANPFATAHVTPAPPALIPTQHLASDVITRDGTGLFGKAKNQYEQLRRILLNTPDLTGERLWEHTLALVEPLLGVPVAIYDLEGLAEIGIGEAEPGERTVTSSAAEDGTHGAGSASGKGATKRNGKGTAEGKGAGKTTTVSSEGKGLGTDRPSGKGATKSKGK